MAKEKVTHRCGHDSEVSVFGPYRDRAGKLDWHASQDCPDCRRAALEAKRAQATVQATEQATADGLPTLTGTDRQVEWAVTIRQSIIADTDALGARVATHPEAPMAQVWDEYRAWLVGQVIAAWWIERRDMTAQDIATAWWRARQ